jgi:hypothetical protein
MEGHLDGCPSCRRYDEVLRTGVELLRELEVEHEDGVPVGTIHRLALDAQALERTPAPASLPTLAGVAAAVVLAMAALASWAPGLFGRGTPELDLAPVVATAPAAPQPARAGYLPLPAAFPFEAAPTGFQTLSRSLLYRYGGPVQSRAVRASAPPLD